MKKTIVHYHLYGEKDTTPLPDFVHCETIASRSKAYNWEITPHIHTQLYQIFFIETGAGHLILDKGNIAFTPPCIIVMPSNNLHGFHYSAPTDGRVITLSESYLDALFKNVPKVVTALNQVQLIAVSTQLKAFFALMDSIEKELYEDFSEKRMAVQAYLNLLLIEVYRLTKQEETGLKNDNRQLKYFKDFQKSMRKAQSISKTVKEYAQELAITTVHLNRVCQAVAQKSVSQLAEEFIIAEAQKYLAHTSYSITEIAYMLDFNDPAYFSRLFKKQTQASPKQFRTEALK
jgi:AraC family transcriptional regulator, transcriptional activator of pobA